MFKIQGKKSTNKYLEAGNQLKAGRYRKAL